MFKYAILVEEVNSLQLMPVDVEEHFGEPKKELMLSKFNEKISFYTTGKPKITADAFRFTIKSPMNSREYFCYGDAVFVKKTLFGYKPFTQDDINLIKRNVIRTSIDSIL